MWLRYWLRLRCRDVLDTTPKLLQSQLFHRHPTLIPYNRGICSAIHFLSPIPHLLVWDGTLESHQKRIHDYPPLFNIIGKPTLCHELLAPRKTLAQLINTVLKLVVICYLSRKSSWFLYLGYRFTLSLPESHIWPPCVDVAIGTLETITREWNDHRLLWHGDCLTWSSLAPLNWKTLNEVCSDLLSWEKFRGCWLIW